MKKSGAIGRRKPLSVKRVQARFEPAFHALRMYTYAIWGVCCGLRKGQKKKTLKQRLPIFGPFTYFRRLRAITTEELLQLQSHRLHLQVCSALSSSSSLPPSPHPIAQPSRPPALPLFISPFLHLIRLPPLLLFF